MARKKVTKQTFSQRLQRLHEKEAMMYEKEGIMRRYVIAFPNRRKAPLLGRIGIALLARSNSQIQTEYKENK